LLAFAASRIIKQKFGVRANVLISQEESNPLTSTMGNLGSLFGAQGNVDDEIFVISSHSLYRDVVRDLGINVTSRVKDGFLLKHLAYPEYPLELTAAPGIMDTMNITLNVKVKVNKKGKVDAKMKYRRHTIAEVEDATLPVVFNTPMGQYTLTKTKYFPEGEDVSATISISGYDVAADELAKDIYADIASKRSNVINMGIDTENSAYGEDILNEIIKKYNERGINEKNLQGQKTAEFIDDRLRLLSSDLSDAESNIETYKQSKGIIDVGSEAKFQTEKRAGLEEQRLTTETQLEILKMTSEFLNNPANAYELIPLNLSGSSDQQQQPGIDAYNELVLQRMSLLAHAKEDNSSVKVLSSQIDAMRKNIIASVNHAYKDLSVALRDVRAEQAKTMGKLGDVPTQEREYLDLKRQQAVKQELYMFLLKQREETAMMLANAVPKGIVVDAAYTMSDPLGLDHKAYYLIGLILGLFFPPVFIYLSKLLRNKFDTRQDVEKIVDVPILGEICTDRTGESLVVTADSTTSCCELFRLLRTNLLFVLNDVNDKVVLMTSTTSGEGKSFISANLAATMALLNKKVLLIGMDIRNPQLAQYLKLSPRFGLTQYLSSTQINLDDIITPLPGYDNLSVIVAGPVPPNPGELLASHRVDELFATLRERYDYIIVDTAPVGMVSDTFTLDRISDATVYVCRANYTPSNELRSLVGEIHDNNRLKKLSIVVNGTASKRVYTYGYGQKGTKTSHKK
jgi:capsular exopolysaccharide synthesis family protein